VTVPVPVPPGSTDNTGSLWIRLKIAVTFSLALSVTTHVGLLPQLPPFHPAKVELVAGVAVRVTGAPRSKLALQV
jgi:hypothetical protein